MIKLLKGRFRKSLTILAAVVDIFSLIQIIQQTQFKMPQAFNSAWFWLFIITTATIGAMLLYFKFQDFKQQIADYKKGMEAYKGRVTEEFYKRMAEESNLHKRCNELGWKLEELKTQMQLSTQNQLAHNSN